MSAHVYVLIAALGGMSLAYFEACTPASKPAPAAIGAEAVYTAALLDCVDKSNTLAESRLCRATVDARWGISDGGIQ